MESGAGYRHAIVHQFADVLEATELRERRTELGLTQAALAEVLGVAANTVARWERGEHPVGHPERVRRALDTLGDRTPSQPPPGTHTNRGNVPADLSSFIGRRRELFETGRLLDHARLLTLTGSGGVGKSRLAVRLAAAVEARFPDGVWLVQLGALADPQLVIGSIARALGIREHPSRTLVTGLVERLHGELLLVLDNCEHLVEASARSVVMLLSECPRLHVLATSREPLGIDGEVTWTVPPLKLPEPQKAPALDTEDHSEAIQLFVERARAVRPEFALTPDNVAAVIDVCRRLDGIPLALELAASQLRGLSTGQLAAMLNDGFPRLANAARTAPARHQTLRATLDWSYCLLAPAEQRMLERVAVFAGGFTLEAAETVCPGVDERTDSVLPGLQRLVAASLVLVDVRGEAPVRYRLLQTVRDYTFEKLADSAFQDEVQSRHASYFAELVEDLGAEERTMGAAGRASLDQLEREHDNARAALAWSLRTSDAHLAMRLAHALSSMWETRGHFAEARRWFGLVLDLPEARGPSQMRGMLLFDLARCARRQGDYVEAREFEAESLALAQELGDSLLIANASMGLGNSALGIGDFGEAAARFATARTLYREVRNQRREGMAVGNLGHVAVGQGKFAEAQLLGTEALALARATESTRGATGALRVLGYVAHGQGDHGMAKRLFEQAITISRGVGHRLGLGAALEGLGLVMTATGQLADARDLFAEALQVYQQTDARLGQIGCLEGLARLAARDDPARALQLAAASASERDSVGATLSPRARHDAKIWLQQARHALGSGAAQRAWVAGRRLTLDEASNLAREIAPRDATVPVVRQRTAGTQLTEREQEVLALLAGGRTNSEIATQLVLSIRTVERHIANTYAKIGARRRSEATAYALRQGLV